MLKSGIAILCIALIAGTAYGEEGKPSPGLLERGMARIEHGLARLQARLAGHASDEHAQDCQDMMGGGMMEGAGKGGGMMGGGMMGGGTPNDQWRGSKPK